MKTLQQLDTQELTKLMYDVLAEVEKRLMPKSYLVDRKQIHDDSKYGISASFPGGSSIVDDWVAEMAEDFED